jgi:hypothetical protein
MFKIKNAMSLFLFTVFLIVGCGPSEQEKFNKMKDSIINNTKLSYGVSATVRELQNKVWIVCPEKQFSIKDFVFLVDINALENPSFYTEESIWGRKFIQPTEKNGVGELEDALAYKDASTGIMVFPVINKNMTSNDFLKVIAFDSKDQRVISEMSSSTMTAMGYVGAVIAGLFGQYGAATDLVDIASETSRENTRRAGGISPDKSSGIILAINMERLTTTLEDVVNKQKSTK